MRSAIAPLAVLAAAAALYVGGNKLLFSDDGGYVVRAEMRDASGLAKESAVKIGGVPAGSVIDIALTKRDTALVTMRLEKGAAPVKDGTTARVRPVNLLGEKYVELAQGAGRALASGGRIPIQRTSHAVELDDVFNTLDADTRARLAVLINESGVAMNHRGRDFNAMLKDLPPALGDSCPKEIFGVTKSRRRSSIACAFEAAVRFDVSNGEVVMHSASGVVVAVREAGRGPTVGSFGVVRLPLLASFFATLVTALGLSGRASASDAFASFVNPLCPSW